MTTNNFKKAIANAVKNYEYASAIMNYMRLESNCCNGAKLGHTNVAIISVIVKKDAQAIKRWRVYYNFNTMKNEIAAIDFETYSEAREEFAKFAN